MLNYRELIEMLKDNRPADEGERCEIPTSLMAESYLHADHDEDIDYFDRSPSERRVFQMQVIYYVENGDFIPDRTLPEWVKECLCVLCERVTAIIERECNVLNNLA